MIDNNCLSNLRKKNYYYKPGRFANEGDIQIIFKEDEIPAGYARVSRRWSYKKYNMGDDATQNYITASIDGEQVHQWTAKRIYVHDGSYQF